MTRGGILGLCSNIRIESTDRRAQLAQRTMPVTTIGSSDNRVVVIVRDFDQSRDSAALRDCFIELQNYERQLDPGKPEGSTVAEAYLERMFARCREWDGRVFVAEVLSNVVGF